jgi:hypothetical protein
MRADRRWIIYRGTTVLGYYSLANIPEVEAGCVAMELSETDDGVSDWYFHDEYGLIMEGAEPSDELDALDPPND